MPLVSAPADKAANNVLVVSKKVNKYDKEIPQSQTKDKPMPL